jgi:hypothetical protein
MCFSERKENKLKNGKKIYKNEMFFEKTRRSTI